MVAMLKLVLLLGIGVLSQESTKARPKDPIASLLSQAHQAWQQHVPDARQENAEARERRREY